MVPFGIIIQSKIGPLGERLPHYKHGGFHEILCIVYDEYMQ
jgi:hypothetical protein